jgi:hypothetical protein
MLGMMHVYSPQQPNPIVDDFKRERERETIFLDNVKLFFFNFKNFINTLENTKFDVY